MDELVDEKILGLRQSLDGEGVAAESFFEAFECRTAVIEQTNLNDLGEVKERTFR